MPTQREKIIKKAREILENSPEGIRYSDLVRKIQDAYPEIKLKVIQWETYNLHKKFKDIAKPERGLFILKKFLEEKIKTDLREVKEAIKKAERLIGREENFYQPFADYLVNDLDECTSAMPLGGNRFQDRWGTPDIFGVYKFSETDPIKPLVEIVSAEIKTDTNQLITAFGQACAYKLFSHKVYLAIPKDAPEKDVARLESLCLRFGIGLILFDSKNPEDPKFEIRTRAIKNEPDYFYVNEYLKKLNKEELKKLGL
jgi:hypothetical protein